MFNLNIGLGEIFFALLCWILLMHVVKGLKSAAVVVRFYGKTPGALKQINYLDIRPFRIQGLVEPISECLEINLEKTKLDNLQKIQIKMNSIMVRRVLAEQAVVVKHFTEIKGATFLNDVPFNYSQMVEYFFNLNSELAKLNKFSNIKLNAIEKMYLQYLVSLKLLRRHKRNINEVFVLKGIYKELFNSDQIDKKKLKKIDVDLLVKNFLNEVPSWDNYKIEYCSSIAVKIIIFHHPNFEPLRPVQLFKSATN